MLLDKGYMYDCTYVCIVSMHEYALHSFMRVHAQGGSRWMKGRGTKRLNQLSRAHRTAAVVRGMKGKTHAQKIQRQAHQKMLPRIRYVHALS